MPGSQQAIKGANSSSSTAAHLGTQEAHRGRAGAEEEMHGKEWEHQSLLHHPEGARLPSPDAGARAVTAACNRDKRPRKVLCTQVTWPLCDWETQVQTMLGRGQPRGQR